MASGCTYQQPKDVFGPNNKPMPCDTAMVSFGQHIRPILQAHCNICHSSGGTSFPLEEHDEVQYRALLKRDGIGVLYGAVAHLPAFQAMPRDAPKLTLCQIEQIKRWTDAGAPNN